MYLNTPRLITNQLQQPVWKSDNTEPFGDSVPNENPSALGVFKFPLRFMGTYDDQETGTLYNGRRQLDQGSGRYQQADPLGLSAGINLYAHVSSSPLMFTDPFGLKICKKCSEAIDAVRQILESFNPQAYKRKCGIVCAPAWRGRGGTSGNTITLNSREYGDLTDLNYVNYTQTIAHELRHCGQSWWDGFRSIPPVTDEPHFYNEFHTNLDLQAQADAWAVEPLVKKALDGGACCK